LTPAETIRYYRMEKASLLLLEGSSPGVVAYEVGFTSHSYFSRCFKTRYRCLPCNFKKHHGG
jgi:AraC-like DNA-binding protein